MDEPEKPTINAIIPFAVTTSPTGLPIVFCNDGSVWELRITEHTGHDPEWCELPPVPATVRAQFLHHYPKEYNTHPTFFDEDTKLKRQREANRAAAVLAAMDIDGATDDAGSTVTEH